MNYKALWEQAQLDGARVDGYLVPPSPEYQSPAVLWRFIERVLPAGPWQECALRTVVDNRQRKSKE